MKDRQNAVRSVSVSSAEVRNSINPFSALRDFYFEHQNDYFVYLFFPSALANILGSMSSDVFSDLRPVCQSYLNNHYLLSILAYFYSFFKIDLSAIITDIDNSQIIKDHFESVNSDHNEDTHEDVREHEKTSTPSSVNDLDILTQNQRGIAVDKKDESAQSKQEIDSSQPLIKLLQSITISNVSTNRDNLKRIMEALSLYKKTTTYIDRLDNNRVVFLIEKMKSLGNNANAMNKPLVQDLIISFIKKQDWYLAEIVFYLLKKSYAITGNIKDILLTLSKEGQTLQFVYGVMGYKSAEIESFKDANACPEIKFPAFALERALDSFLATPDELLAQINAEKIKTRSSTTKVNMKGVEVYLEQRAYVDDVLRAKQKQDPTLYQAFREDCLKREAHLTKEFPELKTILDYLRANHYKQQSLAVSLFDPILLERLLALPKEERLEWAELIRSRQKDIQSLSLEELNSLLTDLIDHDSSCVFSNFTTEEFGHLKEILNEKVGLSDVTEMINSTVSYKKLALSLDQIIRVKEELDKRGKFALSDKLETKLTMLIESNDPKSTHYSAEFVDKEKSLGEQTVNALNSVVRRFSTLTMTSIRHDSDAASTDVESNSSASIQEKFRDDDAHSPDSLGVEWAALSVELELDEKRIMALEAKKRAAIYSILTNVKSNLDITSAIFDGLSEKNNDELRQINQMLKSMLTSEEYKTVDPLILNQVLINFNYDKLVFINDIFSKIQLSTLKSINKTKQEGYFWSNLSKLADRVKQLESGDQEKFKKAIQVLSDKRILTPQILYAFNLNLGQKSSADILPMLEILSKQNLLTEASVLELLSWRENEVALYRPIFSNNQLKAHTFAFLAELRKAYNFSIMEQVVKNAEIVFSNEAEELYRLNKDLFGKILSKNEPDYLACFIELQKSATDVIVHHHDALLKLDAVSLRDFVSKINQLKAMGIKYPLYVEELLQENRSSLIDALNALPEQLKPYFMGFSPVHLKNWQRMDMSNREHFIACLPYLKRMGVPPLSKLANQMMNSQWSNRLSVFQTLETHQFPPETWSSMLKLNQNEFNRVLSYGPYLLRLKQSRLNVEVFFDVVIQNQNVASYVENIESLYVLFKDSEIDLSELNPTQIDNLLMMNEHNRQAIKDAGPYLRKIGDSSFELLSDSNANTRWGQQLFSFKILEKIQISPKKWLNKENDLLMFPEAVLRAGSECDEIKKGCLVSDVRITLTTIQGNLTGAITTNSEAKNLEILLNELGIADPEKAKILEDSSGKWVAAQQAILFLEANGFFVDRTLFKVVDLPSCIEKIIENQFILNLGQLILKSRIMKGYDNTIVQRYLEQLFIEDDIEVRIDILSSALEMLQKDEKHIEIVMRIIKEAGELDSEQQKDVLFCLNIMKNNPVLFNERNIKAVVEQITNPARKCIFMDRDACEGKKPINQKQFDDLLVNGKINTGSTLDGVFTAAKSMHAFLNKGASSTASSTPPEAKSSTTFGKGKNQ